MDSEVDWTTYAYWQQNTFAGSVPTLTFSSIWKVVNENIKGDNKKMANEVIDPYIVANFPVTEEAVLVAKWFGGAYSGKPGFLPTSPTTDYIARLVMEAVLPDWKARVLAKAQELEAEEQAKKGK